MILASIRIDIAYRESLPSLRTTTGGGSMATWLCHLIRSFTANFIQRFHVATVYINVSRALDQHSIHSLSSSPSYQATVADSIYIKSSRIGRTIAQIR